MKRLMVNNSIQRMAYNHRWFLPLALVIEYTKNGILYQEVLNHDET